MSSFHDQTCVVTGAASGIGYALSERLLQAGAWVMLSDRDEGALGEAAARLHAHAGRLRTHPADVCEATQVGQLIHAAVAWRGRVDLLFNNAGIGGTLPVRDATLPHWQRVLDVNLWGVIHGIQAVLPVMLAQGSGHIVNTASVAGVLPVPGQALYNASKYAVVGLGESLRLELAADGMGP